jgi:hypothetical protein
VLLPTFTDMTIANDHLNNDVWAPI